MSNFNATQAALVLISEALQSVSTLADYDRDNITDELQVPELIYYSSADQVLSDYEGKYGLDAQDFTNGQEYPAHAWQQAQMDYAQAVWQCAVTGEVSQALDDLENVMAYFTYEVELLGGEPDDATFSPDCVYGWEAHNYETAEGVMVWGAKNPHSDFNCNPRLLEGELYAVSYRLPGGMYLNLAWTPETSRLSGARAMDKLAMGLEAYLTGAACYMDGFNEVPGTTEMNPDVLGGWIGLVVELTSYVPYMLGCVTAIRRYQPEYPGVFDYEVSIEFGKWFGKFVAENQDVPSTKEAREWLKRAVFEFFTQEG